MNRNEIKLVPVSFLASCANQKEGVMFSFAILVALKKSDNGVTEPLLSFSCRFF